MATKSSRLGALKHLRKEISSIVNGSAIPLFVMAFLPVLFTMRVLSERLIFSSVFSQALYIT
jgi:hypothetical protein